MRKLRRLHYNLNKKSLYKFGRFQNIKWNKTSVDLKPFPRYAMSGPRR